VENKKKDNKKIEKYRIFGRMPSQLDYRNWFFLIGKIVTTNINNLEREGQNTQNNLLKE